MDSKKSNSIWFDSPCHNSSRHGNLHLLKVDVQHEPEQSVHLNDNLESPLQPAHRNTPKSTMSPWSKLLLFNENKQDQIQMNSVISQPYQNAIIEQKVVYSDLQQQEQVTPQIKKEENQKQDSDAQRTTAKKQTSKRPVSERKAKILEKGLRKLSQRAFEIVRELKYATYKQVASMLAQQLNYLELEGQNREEQNIKRRVYDALNVLIALGVLRKDGKKIVSQSVHNKRKELGLIRNEELDCLRQKLEEKQTKIDQKRQRLRQTEGKYQSIGTLLNRNKHKNYLRTELVIFPFIGILLPEETSLSVLDVEKTRFMLRSDYPANIFGDIDCLKWLGDGLGGRLEEGKGGDKQCIIKQCKIEDEWG